VDAAEALLEALWRKADSYEGFAVNRKDLITELGERIDFHRFVVVWWRLLTPMDVLEWLSDHTRLSKAAGRQLSRDEVDLLAESWRTVRSGPSVADIALLDELRVLLGVPPKRRGRRAVPLVEASQPAPRRPEHYDEYSHIVVDEVQDLSPMQWRMIGRRGAYASWTLVGDPVQSSWPDAKEAATARDAALGTRTARRQFTLRTNYRNSAEIFELARRVVDEVAAPEELPTAVRKTGEDPVVLVVEESALAESVREAARELLGAVDGTVGVIASLAGVARVREWVAGIAADRLRVVDSMSAKGLEYDAVVVVEPTELVTESMTGPRTLYVALTRATQRLTVVTTDPAWP
jgi:hypothetical protein